MECRYLKTTFDKFDSLYKNLYIEITMDNDKTELKELDLIRDRLKWAEMLYTGKHKEVLI